MIGPLVDTERGPVVVVSGLPGSGKSTLAEQLHDELGLALLSLDTVKEAVVDGLGPQAPEDRFAIRRAARQIVVDLAAANPRGCLIDIWIDPHGDESGFCEGLRSLGAVPVLEVLCRVPVDVAIERYRRRQRHPAHLPMDDSTERRIRDAAPLIGPLGLGPHLDVDTTTPVLGPRLDTVLDWLADRTAAGLDRP